MATHEHPLAADSARTPAVSRKSNSVAQELEAATICFAGDATDAVHLLGAQFTNAATGHGNYVCTLPDPPAEIRAPAGTLAGVVAIQIQFSKHAIHTPGDRLLVLVALNPAALKTLRDNVEPGGIVLVDSDAFSPFEWQKAGYHDDPLEDGALKNVRLAALPITQLNRDAVAKVKLSPREAERSKGFFVLGLALWIFDLPIEPTLHWIRETYDKNAGMIEAGTRSLKAGARHAETCGLFPVRYRVGKATMPSGRFRQITGADAMALGLLSAAELADLPLVFASFPVAPASGLLHRLCEWKQPRVTVTQAEDDLAALNIALGAAYGGALGATATTGPGLSLQSETLGLAVMSELPCVVIDVQRAGPSTGMPTKTEQADLFLALHGRHGECPLIVLAPATSADGFAIIIEAARLAIRFMTPVIVLADAYLAHSAETWRVPDLKELSSQHGSWRETAREWVLPGTPGMEYRIGGQEKDANGNVSFDPINHEQMVTRRAAKIAAAANAIAPLEVAGTTSGDLLVLGWGSTKGAITQAVDHCRRKGIAVASAHLRHLLPMPANTAEVLARYRRILVPELNAGQLAQVLRANFDVDVVSLTKIQGRPFSAGEIEQKIEALQEKRN